MEYCDKHMESITDIATIKQTVIDLKDSFDEVKSRMVSHINEGEREGGVRSRLIIAEKDIKDIREEISTIKKGYWISGLVGGVIGALGAQAIPELIPLLSKIIK